MTQFGKFFRHKTYPEHQKIMAQKRGTVWKKFKCHKSYITKNNRLMSCHHIVRCWLCFLSSAISYHHQHHPPPHSSSSSSSSVNNVLISIIVCLLQLQCFFPGWLYAYAMHSPHALCLLYFRFSAFVLVLSEQNKESMFTLPKKKVHGDENKENQTQYVWSWSRSGFRQFTYKVYTIQKQKWFRCFSAKKRSDFGLNWTQHLHTFFGN